MKTPIPVFPDRHCRARPSKALKDEILRAQNLQCLNCEAELVDVQFDHIVPLGLGGANLPDNWAALCPRCHRNKTKLDLKMIAKAKRQRRYHQTGRSRAPSTKRGFDKSLRRHFNGAVSRRCKCETCRTDRGGGYDA